MASGPQPDVHITAEGLAQVRRELDELRTVRRPYIADKIRAARELGDLSENFEYHAAKNEQGFIEARIAELETIERNAKIIEPPAATDVVSLGSTVRFVEDGQAEETYRIVGPAEADPKAGKVSDASAVGRALLQHRVGDEVSIETESGFSYTVRITGIQ
jgi:transcription elongation factor GreA